MQVHRTSTENYPYTDNTNTHSQHTPTHNLLCIETIKSSLSQVSLMTFDSNLPQTIAQNTI